MTQLQATSWTYDILDYISKMDEISLLTPANNSQNIALEEVSNSEYSLQDV